jgi:hypothetical protein
MKHTPFIEKNPKSLSLANSSKRQSKSQPTKHQVQQRPHVRVWRAGDYPEVFVYIAVNRFGATWTVKESGESKMRDIVLAPDAPTALDRSVECARHWIRTNLPGAKIRVRSNLERAVLFGVPSLPLYSRRRAA